MDPLTTTRGKPGSPSVPRRSWNARGAQAPSDEHDRYRSPLLTRYASAEMSALFSERATALLWRRVWLALAESEQAVGVPIATEQVRALRENLDRIDFVRVAELERELRHDVMAHIHAYGEVAPEALPILHLGATSADVTDNAAIVQLRDALDLVRRRTVEVLRPLAELARTHASVPALGWTHFQAAQPTTVGKRVCLWIQDLLFDLREVERRLEGLRLRGLKGATGTQGSFLALLGGDAERVTELERLFCAHLGFDGAYPVTGQTYPRKVDAQVLDALAGLGQSCAKFAHDLRLLQHLHEVEEPMEERQVGSSAMPYKRNPMRAERMSGLARYLIVTTGNGAWTAASQWLERSLDDSANRRLALPEAFLAADALLVLYLNVVEGLAVRAEVSAARVRRELPFLASEVLLAEGVRRGGSRQALHEIIRRHARDARAAEDPEEGQAAERFLAALGRDPDFPLDRGEVEEFLASEAFVGLAPEQVERFLAEEVDPVLEARSELRIPPHEVRV